MERASIFYGMEHFLLSRPGVMAIGLSLFVALSGCQAKREESARRCLELGDWPRAAKLYTQILDEDPANPSARIGMARALVQKAQSQALSDQDQPAAWEEAARELEIAQGFSPDSSLRRDWARTTYLWARSLTTHGDTVAALGRLKELLHTDPRQLAARNFAAILEYRRGHARTARELLLQNVALDSTDVPTLYNLGLLEWNENDAASAHRWWLAALRRDPRDENALWWLVQAERKLEP